MKFQELDVKVQEKISYEEDFSSMFEETELDFAEKLKDLGFRDVKVYYSGFNCQGDGASFCTDKLDIVAVLRSMKSLTKFKGIRHLIEDGSICFGIDKVGRYDHENTMRINETYYGDFTHKQYDLCCDLVTDILEYSRSLAVQFYKDLEKINDMRYDMKVMAEYFEGADFEEDGTMI